MGAEFASGVGTDGATSGIEVCGPAEGIGDEVTSPSAFLWDTTEMEGDFCELSTLVLEVSIPSVFVVLGKEVSRDKDDL